MSNKDEGDGKQAGLHVQKEDSDEDVNEDEVEDEDENEDDNEDENEDDNEDDNEDEDDKVLDTQRSGTPEYMITYPV
jgi:hypothetical protein